LNNWLDVFGYSPQKTRAEQIDDDLASMYQRLQELNNAGGVLDTFFGPSDTAKAIELSNIKTHIDTLIREKSRLYDDKSIAEGTAVTPEPITVPIKVDPAQVQQEVNQVVAAATQKAPPVVIKTIADGQVTFGDGTGVGSAIANEVEKRGAN
jgi:hypothetical protein